MESTKSTSKHEYLGTHRNISLYRTEDVLFAHIPDTARLMEVPLNVPLSRLADHASEFNRQQIQATGDAQRASEYELLPVMLHEMEKAGGTWSEVTDGKAWLSTYLATLICNPEQARISGPVSKTTL
jgi:hypothetical protein